MFLGTAEVVQRTLSKFQAIPIIGSIPVSPVKAVVSIAQIVAGVAGAVIFGILAFFVTFIPPGFRATALWENAFESVIHVQFGTLSLIYSLVNFGTGGLFGLFVEVIIL